MNKKAQLSESCPTAGIPVLKHNIPHRFFGTFPEKHGCLLTCLMSAALTLMISGCGGNRESSSEIDSSEAVSAVSSPVEDSVHAGNENSTNSRESTAGTQEQTFDLKPLQLSGLPGGQNSKSEMAGGEGSAEQQIQSVIRQLQPLQILLGQWRGTTRREYENFKAVDNHEWVWDLRSDPKAPALTITSDKSPYIRDGRMSWDPKTRKFILNIKDGTGNTRHFTGDFVEPVREIVGSDDKLHKVFKIEFTQDDAGESAGERWQIAFEQQENNRYLLEVAKRRGSAGFARFDTVSTQREGTSFAVSDSGYAERTCIISEGLGTTELTYKGRSYWVCCSGCRAAFEEDPETWIARAAARAPK